MNWILLTTITLALSNPFNIGFTNSISDATMAAQFDKLLIQEEQQEIQAVFTATPTTGTVPVTVQFDASASTGENLTYEWDFGDGTTATGQEVEHLYEKPSSYAVKLTVSNADNMHSAVDVVTVQSLANGDSYILEPDGVLIGLDGILLKPSSGLLSQAININISETQPPELLPRLFGDEEIIGKYYKVSSPDLEVARVPDFSGPVNYIWIGLPVPDGVDPRNVRPHVLNPGSVSINFLSPHWVDNSSAYDPVRNMIFFRHTFNLYGDDSLTIVLSDLKSEVNRYPYNMPPLDSSGSIGTQSR